MALPNQLVNPSANIAGSVNMPGVDPITEDSFKLPLSAQPQVAPVNPMAAQPTDPVPPAMQQPPQAPVAPQEVPEIQPTQPLDLKTSPLGPVQAPHDSAENFEKYWNDMENSYQQEKANNIEKANKYKQSAQEQKAMLGLSDQEWVQAQAEQAKREKAMDDVIAKGRAMSIDPQRYWNRAGTASNIMSAIAVGLGSFASGMTRGATGNPAMSLLTQAIDHDIAAQKADVDNYWQSVKDQFQLDDNVFNRALANQNYRANQRLAAFKVVESEIASIEAKSANPAVQRAAADLRLKIQTSQNAEREKAATAIAAAQKAAQQAQAAAAAINTANAKERNNMYQKFYDTNMAQGMSPEEASAAAWKASDAAYPQLAKTQFASPGQKYDAMATKAIDIAQAQKAQINKLPKDKAIANIIKNNPGISAADAESQYQLLKTSSVDVLAQQILRTSGVVDPYAGAKTSSSSDDKTVTDPLTGQSTKFKTAADATKYREDLDAKTVVDPFDPSKTYRFKTEAEAKKFREANMGLFSAAQSIDKLKQIRQEGNEGGFNTWLEPGKAKRAEKITGDIVAGINSARNGGILGDKDAERILASLPDVTQRDTVIDFPRKVDVNAELDTLKQDILDTGKANAMALGGKVYNAQAATPSAKGSSSSPSGAKPVPATKVNPSGPTYTGQVYGQPKTAQATPNAQEAQDWIANLEAKRRAAQGE